MSERLRKRYTSWLPIGVIGIILSIILFVGSNYADNYVEWLDTWHSTPFGKVRDYRTPYKNYAFPLCILGFCLLVIGILSIWYDYTIRREGSVKL